MAINPMQVFHNEGLSFKFRNKLSNASGGSLNLNRDLIVKNSTFDKIDSTATLILKNCRVGEVTAKNLAMVNCSFEKATAEKRAFVDLTVSYDNTVEMIYHAKHDIFLFFPLGSKCIRYKKCNTGNDLLVGTGFEKVIAENCTIKRNIVFEGNDTSIPKQAILRGTTVLGGEVIGGILVDERQIRS